MIKNWTVITQPVKDADIGLIKRERYLTNIKHPNHRKTRQIISLFGSAKTTQRIALAGADYRANQSLNQKRGGRPLSSYAMEFCLSLPKEIRPTQEQWKNIITHCCKSIARKLNLSPEERQVFGQYIRAVIHQQNNNSNDHVHLIIGKVIKGNLHKELQQKSITKHLKLAYNAAVYHYLNITPKHYNPVSKNYGKRLEMWRYQSSKAQINQTALELLKRLENQSNKFFAAIEENNATQKNRQLNRMEKVFDELNNHHLDESTKNQIGKLKEKIKPFRPR